MRQKILLTMYLKQACFNDVILKAKEGEGKKRKENLDTTVGTLWAHCECSSHSNQ